MSTPSYDEDGYDDYYADDLDDEGEPCSICGGDAYDECHDPIQCGAIHVNGWCPCGACRGSGLRSQQWSF